MFDTPVYKILSSNDTANAPGKQGGILIPADIEEFFPDIEGEITPATPTADVDVVAVLIVDGHYRATVKTRYQYQTWGGTRSRERRLTAGLGPLTKEARKDDMVLFSRDPEKPDQMMLTLIRQNTAEYDHVVAANSGARWGVVQGLPSPAGNQQIRIAAEEIEAISSGEFSMFDNDRPVTLTPSLKKARGAAFRQKLIRAYGTKCLASGESIATPDSLLNLDAAHIVPVEVGGSDDVRNGLLLSKDLHWAFDKGLFSLADDYSILVSSFARQSTHSEPVKRIEGHHLKLDDAVIRPHQDAISWHRTNRFLN